MDVMGSPYLIAHGLGRPVCDATAEVELPAAGKWRVYVRTRSWLPVDAAASITNRPGAFRLLVDSHALGRTFGRGMHEWSWEDGGEILVERRNIRVTLRDEDGFDGRCAGVVFCRGDDRLPDDKALSMSNASVSERRDFDFVVVGGGVPGCCAAVSAARSGLKVALVQDRLVLGGNSSSEIRVYSAGEQRHPIVKELRSLFLNRDANNAISDAYRRAVLEREKNLSLFLGHRVFSVEKQGSAITAAKALDLSRNRVVAFAGRYFCDATGDGWLGYYAGADCRMGRESRNEFDESFAPEKTDSGTLGASLMWESSEADADVPFSAPWAEPFACGESAVSGEWNWEYGLDKDMIAEGEAIRDRLLLAIYGAFSLAKREKRNSRRMLTTCPYLLGKRESRRLVGDWIYRESDITNRVEFADAVATGSWSVDLHYQIDKDKPFLTRCEQPHFGRYYIPYRSLYSRNVSNLFMAGRCFSCTHVGLAGPRVICTLGQMGVAVGTAAAFCKVRNCSPRGLYEMDAMRELQRALGGDWPGNPDPERRSWIVVDDEDSAAEFGPGWERRYNPNGGQRGNQSTYLTQGMTTVVSPVYSFGSIPVGRYRLKALTPYAYSTRAWGLGVVSLDLQFSGGKRRLEWDQRADSGEWSDLGAFALSGDVRICVSPRPRDGGSVIVLDAFALIPEKGEK